MTAATHKSDLRPLPMRITGLQYERLVAARSRDGMAVQEHVRRALDFYLAKLEREFERKLPLPPANDVDPDDNREATSDDVRETVAQLADVLPRAPANVHPRSGKPASNAGVRPAPVRVRSR
jgi:hypothetical protein